jgi:mono/diheme cytochrome c family protein
LTGLLLILLIVCLIFIPEDRPRYWIRLPLYILCFLAVAGLGYLGGQLALGERCPEAPSGAFSAGAKIFRINCSACHPQGGNILNPKLPVVGAPELANSEAFLTYLRKPRRPDGSTGSMPPFLAKKIPDPEIKELYAYIINVLEKQGRR